MIGPLAIFFGASNLFKIVLRYFGKVYHKSNMCILWFDLLIAFYLFTSLVCNLSFLIVKKQLCQGRTHWCCVFSSDTTSTDHCARTYFWWVRTHVPYLFSVHLPNWHFPLHLPLSVCVHSYQPAPKLQPHFHGRQFPMLSTPDQHLG